MKIITNYGQFLNESFDDTNASGYSLMLNDIIKMIEYLEKVPTEEIIELRDAIEKMGTQNESLNENFVTDMISKLRIKFRKDIDDRMWKYLINRKQDFYLALAEKLNIFDLTSLDDVFKNHPGFKLEALYLAGGMDKAKDVGAGWRIEVEHEFEIYPGKSPDVPKVDLKEFGMVQPKRVVDGVYVDMFLENPSKIKKMYDSPLILNPIRKEIDRTKDMAFAAGAGKYKTFGQNTAPEEYEPTMTDIRKTLSRSIEPGDEHLVRVVDAIFLGLNIAGAAGTYAELQTTSFMNKPIFVWMNEKDWKFSDFSMWNFPHISKLARNEEEMKILVGTIINSV